MCWGQRVESALSPVLGSQEGGARVTHVGSVVQEEWSALALGISHEVSGERHITGL